MAILRGILEERKTRILREPLIKSLQGGLLGSSTPEVHYCFKCSQPFNPDNAEYCPVCGVLKCHNGGHCLCSLSPEARMAVENELTSLDMWEHGSPKRKKRHR